MANEHPFQHLFETLGRPPIAHAESVNRKAYDVLSDILSVAVEKPGRCILLRATRAGHGKTHLLSRIQHQLGATHQFVPLTASFGSRIDACSVIDDTLRCLVKQLPASGGLSVLDLVTRRLFASALQPLVGSGEVPCQDREGALTALRLRPVETFDFHHPNAVTAHWARENFEVLGQRLSLELAHRGGLPVREVAFWVDILFRYASAPLDFSGRISGLSDAVHQGSGGEMERLETLLGLVTQLTRVVLVADDLEGFSSDESAALKFAAFLGTLRQSVERLDVIISLNQDIWESAFLPRLSGGLADRLSEVVVELEPLKEEEMAALLDSRVPGLGAKVLERIDVASSGRHARGLIRAAGMAWLKATATDTSREAPPAPVSIPVPEVFQAVEKVITPTPQPAVADPVVVEELAEAQAPTIAPLFETEPTVKAQRPAFEAPPVVEEQPPVFEAPPVVEAQKPLSEAQHTVTTPQIEDAPMVETEPSWPTTAFAPPEPVFLEPEPPIDQSVLSDSGFFESPTSQSEPLINQPVVNSPFQAMIYEPVAAPQIAPEPPAPLHAETEPQIIQESQPTSYDSGLSQENFQEPPPLYQEPPREPSIQQFQPVYQESQPIFQAPVETPFQAFPQQFQPVYQETQPVFQAPVESPFQAAPQEFIPASVVQQFQPEPTPIAPPAVNPEVEPTLPPPDTDRVDDLLRQFRERYGRGSL